jgi:hypothetical protein
MGERDGFKPRPAEEKFVTGSRGGTPENAKESVLPVRVGEQKPSTEVSPSAEQVARQMAVQVENIAQFVRGECAAVDDYSSSGLYRKYKMPDNLLIDHFRGAVYVRSLTDPIQGVAGGEFYTLTSSPERTYKNSTELRIPAVDAELVFQKFGFTPSAGLLLPWHFDEPTMRAAINHIQTKGQDYFFTYYFFDKEGHFDKISYFPRDIPDRRPDVEVDRPNRSVRSPITEWDLAVAPGALAMIERKISNLRLRET